MSQNVTFSWTAEKRKAVQLLASGKFTGEEIAEQLTVTRQTLYRWQQNPEFAAAIDKYIADVAAALKAKGIAERQNRINALNERHRRMMAVIEARAAEAGDGAGAETGLLARTYKMLGNGPTAYSVEEWTFDAALVREMREHEKQTAQEVGQWVERQTNLNVDIENLTDEQLARIAAGEDPAAVIGRGKGK